MKQFGVIEILFLFCVTAINGLKLLDSPPSLSSDVLPGNNKPVVLLLDLTKNKQQSSDINDLLAQLTENVAVEDSSTEEEKEIAGEEETYLLYNVLRSTPEDNLDPVVAESIANTKEVLRQALSLRCGKIELCIKTCPKRKPKCPRSCKETFDNYNVCDDKPKPCSKSRCGKTMPPSWLLLKK